MSKYSQNRNLWQKVYPPRRRRPNNKTFTEDATGTSFSYDLNQIIRYRDFFKIEKVFSGSLIVVTGALPTAEYEEGLIAFDYTSQESVGFTSCFSDAPDAVVLTVEPDEKYFTDNIKPYGLSFTACSMSVGLSAPFSGNIRYRASYSSAGYPASASSAFEPASGTFTIFAGTVPITNSVSFAITYSISQSGVPPTPSAVIMTPWDFGENFDVDMHISKSVDVTSSTGGLSAPINNSIYFIAFS